jgi:hypothetical protein
METNMTTGQEEENKQIVNTIFQQFGGNRALRMVGGTVMGDWKNQSLNMAFKGSKKANRLVIKYNRGMDDYTMTFFKVWNGKITKMVLSEGIYGDMLQDVFTNHTGLYLSL